MWVGSDTEANKNGHSLGLENTNPLCSQIRILYLKKKKEKKRKNLYMHKSTHKQAHFNYRFLLNSLIL